MIITRKATDRSQLWSEVAKGLIGLVMAGVLGTVLKLLADAYQARRQIGERRDGFSPRQVPGAYLIPVVAIVLG